MLYVNNFKPKKIQAKNNTTISVPKNGTIQQGQKNLNNSFEASARQLPTTNVESGGKSGN